MLTKCAVYIWHTGNIACVFASYLFLINGELSFWNDASAEREMQEEMKAIIWKSYAGCD